VPSCVAEAETVSEPAADFKFARTPNPIAIARQDVADFRACLLRRLSGRQGRPPRRHGSAAARRVGQSTSPQAENRAVTPNREETSVESNQGARRSRANCCPEAISRKSLQRFASHR